MPSNFTKPCTLQGKSLNYKVNLNKNYNHPNLTNIKRSYNKRNKNMEIKRLSTILKLIANPERMAILFLLLDGDRSITELAQALGSSPTDIANHLARLRTEGIIDFTRYHRIIEYRLISEEAATILNTLRTLKDPAE